MTHSHRLPIGLVLLCLCLGWLAPTAQAQRLHYWFDDDPARLYRTSLSASGEVRLSTDRLATGLHTLHCYVQGSQHPSNVQTLLFLKADPRALSTARTSQLEVRVDDPNGERAARSSFTPDAEGMSTLQVDLSRLDPGLHTLYLRGLSAEGYSTPLASCLVFRSPPRARPSSGATELEVRVDDAGSGQSVRSAFRPDATGVSVLSLDLSRLTPGLHTLYVRARSAEGYGTPLASCLVFCPPSGHRPGSERSVVEYWIDDMQGERHTIPMSTYRQGTYAITIPTGSLAPGLHTLYLRTRSAQGAVSNAYTVLFYRLPRPQSIDYTRLVYWFDDRAERPRQVRLAEAISAGDEVDLVLDANGLTRGQHTLHCYLAGADDFQRSSTATHTFTEEHGLPTSVQIHPPSTLPSLGSTLPGANPNLHVPRTIMSGGEAVFHYRILDAELRPVRGVRLRYAVTATSGQRTELHTEASDPSGIVSLPVPTTDSRGQALIPVGQSGTVSILAAESGDGAQTLEHSTQPLAQEGLPTIHCVPLRSREASLTMGGTVSAKAGGKVGSAKVSGTLSAGLRSQIAFERDEQESITELSYRGSLSGSAEGEVELGDALESSVRGTVEGYMELSGPPRPYPGLRVLHSFISPTVGLMVSGSMLVGINVMEHVLREEHGEATKSLGARGSVSLSLDAHGGKKFKFFNHKVNLEGGLGTQVSVFGSRRHSQTDSWSTDTEGNRTKKSSSGTEYRLGVSGDLELGVGADASLPIARKWKTFEIIRSYRDWWSKLSLDVRGKMGWQVEEITAYDAANRYTKLGVKSEHAFGIELSSKNVGHLGRLVEFAGAKFSIEGEKSFASTLAASRGFARHLRQQQRDRTSDQQLFPHAMGGWVNPLDSYSLPYDSARTVRLLTELSEGYAVGQTQVDEDCVLERDQESSLSFDASIPIYKGSLWSISIGGELALSLSYPQERSLWSVADKRLYRTYRYPKVWLPSVDEPYSWLRSIKDMFVGMFTRDRVERMDRRAEQMCRQQLVYVGSVAAPPVFDTRGVRVYGPKLTRYAELRAAPQTDVSRLRFALSDRALPEGARALFGHFYPAGELMGTDTNGQRLLVLSDFCTLRAYQGDTELQQMEGDMEITCSVGADDLRLVGFDRSSEIHLYYSRHDDGVWEDLGVLNGSGTFRARGLGLYALGAPMIYDATPPALTASLDEQTRLLRIQVTENVGILPASIRCLVNGTSMSLERVSSSEYRLTLPADQMVGERVSLFVEMRDLAGNRGQLVESIALSRPGSASLSMAQSSASLYPTRTNAQVTLRHLSAIIGAEALIYDMAGHIVHRLRVSSPTHTIDVASLPVGQYYVVLEHEGSRLGTLYFERQ